MAEAAAENRSNVSISVAGGGSGVGIAALLEWQGRRYNASREMNAYEYRLV
ncbi:MAG: hypothetical protein H6575_09535 [Lewinellaceae bacterium]|nr:hypothetical protein [Lewinellaceae bacterium]